MKGIVIKWMFAAALLSGTMLYAEQAPLTSAPFGISLYQATYLLPFFYTSSPNQQAYASQPNYPMLGKTAVNFQISLKYPLWKITQGQTLNLAYTQWSLWQAYRSDQFFSETDYAPEVFLSNKVNWQMGGDLSTQFINLGLIHQSNGEGGSLERSWNRAYLNVLFSTQKWSLGVEPWYVFHDHTYETQNSNMTSYMGNGQATLSYQAHDQEWSLMARNQLESGFSRGALQLTWSFPLWRSLKGYILLFSGYGLSLMNYNHYTNSVGLGFYFGENEPQGF